MEAKVVDQMEGILRSKSTDDSRKEESARTPRIPKEGLLNDDEEEEENDDVMNGVSDEKEHYTSNSPHIPREGLLQDDDEDDDQSYVDSDDEDEEITLEEIVTWVAETDNRITELDDKLQKTGHTKSGVNRVLDELAKQYGLLEDMQVSFEFIF